ncbi:MAG TPA: FixH family protein [Flavobacterium sp.]|nr:FixH family protein [Flavobacterium sp.]
MKFNWGTGIIIAIIAFMTFILQYVIRVQVDAKYNNELVTESYYEKELEVNDNYRNNENLKELGDDFNIQVVDEGIAVQFPEDFNYQNIEGTISLYRPSDQNLDADISIELSSSAMLIPKNALADGRWDIIVNWQYKENHYYKKQALFL